MRSSQRFLRHFVWAAAVLTAPALPAETIRNHFDTDSVMRAPGFFDAAVLGAPGPARWLVLVDPNPPSAPNKLSQVEAQRPADSIAAAIRRTYAFQDGTVSTFTKRGGSRAGLLLRFQDDKTFVVLLADTTAGDVVLTSYRDGKATELGRGRVKFERDWEKLAVVANGPALTALFDGQKVFEAKDPNPASGKTGLAAAGPGEASFDEFVLEFAPKP